VLDVIRGKSYEECLIMLEFMPYRACEPVGHDRYRPPRHRHACWNPRLLNQMPSYDAARDNTRLTFNTFVVS